jgi:hypothetical protein
VKLKIGIMLSSLVLGLVCFVGCNSEETPTPPATPSGGAKAPENKPPTPPAKPEGEKK